MYGLFNGSMINMVYILKKYLSLAACLSGCFFLSSCENDERKIDELLKKKVAIEEGKQIEGYMSQDSKMKARLISPYMIRSQNDSAAFMEFPNTLHVDFFSDSTQVESTLDAHYAKYFVNQRKIFLRDSVVVINKMNGDTLRAPELWWDQNTEEFTTDKPVRVYQRDKTIFGKFGLKAKQDFSSYDFFGTSGQVQVSDSIMPN